MKDRNRNIDRERERDAHTYICIFMYTCIHMHICMKFALVPLSYTLFYIGSRLKGEDSNDAKSRWIRRGKKGKVGSVGVLFVGAKASQA